MSFNIREAARLAEEKLVAEMTEKGRVPVMEWDPSFETNEMTIKEMLGTDDGAREFVEKVTYDMAAGRDAVPLIYKQLYSTRTDANFPLTLTEKSFGQISVVFLEKFEGGEVTFGAMGPGQEKSVRMHTWATGIEYDEDIVEYNQTWRVTDIGQAFGQSYNKLLNHLHMYPIISGTFATEAGGLTAQRQKQEALLEGQAKYPAAAQLIAFDTDIVTTLQNAFTVLPRGAKLLINSLDLPAVQYALASDMLPNASTGLVAQRLTMNDIVTYDGDYVTVGGETYTYPGVAQGTAFLVVPGTQLVEYVKHDLRVDTGDGDLSRLILAQVVGRTRRGVLAGLAGRDGVVKIALQ